MKKYLLITLIDGQQIEREISAEYQKSIPIGAKPYDAAYMQIARLFATSGFVSDNTNDSKASWIAPTQIKQVDVVFEEPLKVS
ncbi:MAG: hypothetical protein ACK52I_28435 [Pseudomonadota bacterium]|jgi:hypothetical protein